MITRIGKISFLIFLTMSAFASNSILARLAISNNELGPGNFSLIRILSGSMVLVIFVYFRSGIQVFFNIKPDYNGIVGLSLYMIGFHHAYNSLEAGIGSIILFGGVQIIIFSSSIITKDKPTFFNYAGMIIALIGIILLFIPKNLEVELSISGIILMLIAAYGWGIYTLSGRYSKDPFISTMSNFIFTIPVVALSLIIEPNIVQISKKGILLAICSGAIMSALGYLLWYNILPLLEKTTAALVQLLVPIIALILSVLFLNEKLTSWSFISSFLIIGGVTLGIISNNRFNIK